MTDYADQAPPRRQYPDETEAAGGNKSIGEAIGDVTRDMSVLVQQELALAKAEARQSASRAGQAAGMFAGAAVAAFLFDTADQAASAGARLAEALGLDGGAQGIGKFSFHEENAG